MSNEPLILHADFALVQMAPAAQAPYRSPAGNIRRGRASGNNRDRGTKTGRTVIVGLHPDAGPEGPGINDGVNSSVGVADVQPTGHVAALGGGRPRAFAKRGEPGTLLHMVSQSGGRQIRLADGCQTTVHVASFSFVGTRLRTVRLEPAAPFEEWCAQRGVYNAVSGGYSVKPELEPLGELWIDGERLSYRPFAEPWHARRAALAATNGSVEIEYRDRLPTRPGGDLLQAGPLLVRDGRSAIAGVEDPEGFSATADEFDQDLTADREPRLAIARTTDHVLVVAADGRGPHDAGLTLWEFADLLVDLGAQSAINLDGGSAGVVIADGRRLNTPRTADGEDMETSSPSTTAIVLEPSP